jgi:hypothetical protein
LWAVPFPSQALVPRVHAPNQEDHAVNNERPLRTLSALERAAVFDAARAQASRLRREARGQAWQAITAAARAGWHALSRRVSATYVRRTSLG